MGFQFAGLLFPRNSKNAFFEVVQIEEIKVNINDNQILSPIDRKWSKLDGK